MLPEWRTIHPISGKPICGALKSLAAFEAENLPLEEIYKQPLLFKHHICTNEPLVGAEGSGNGRCAYHGGKNKGIVKHGRYMKFPSLLPEDVNPSDLLNKHSDLVEELEIITNFISSSLPTNAEGKFDPSAGAVQPLIQAALTNLAAGNAGGAKIHLENALRVCSESRVIQQAQDRVVSLTNAYTNVFNSEMNRRVRAQEMMSKQQVLGLVLNLMGILSEEIKDINIIGRIKSRFARVIGQGSNGRGDHYTQTVQDVGPENPKQEEGTDSSTSESYTDFL